ncbi:MAG: hypothetical protein H7Z74_14675 [Anaerolineae bacterium]|nr:hypothetical protein [Gemmatimonadaceae bacterium]
MNLLSQFRGVAERLRGGFIAHQSWIDIDGVCDTGRLLRAIEAVMPRDARLNVTRPNAAAVATLNSLALPESRPNEADFFVAMDGVALKELARLADEIAPTPLCAGLFVVQGDRNLLECFRRNAGEDVIWLSSDLDAKIIAHFRQALTAVLTHEEPRSGGERPVSSEPAELSGHRGFLQLEGTST